MAPPKKVKSHAEARAELLRQKQALDNELKALMDKRRVEIGALAEKAGALELDDGLILAALKDAVAKSRNKGSDFRPAGDGASLDRGEGTKPPAEAGGHAGPTD